MSFVFVFIIVFSFFSCQSDLARSSLLLCSSYLSFSFCPVAFLLAAILLGFAGCLRLITPLLAFLRANPASFGIC